MVSKLSEIWFGLFIPDPDPDFLPIRISDPGVKKIPETQHWNLLTVFFFRVNFVLLDPDLIRIQIRIQYTGGDIIEAAWNKQGFLWQDFLVLFRKTLEDPEEDVCFYTIVALTHFVRRSVKGGGVSSCRREVHWCLMKETRQPVLRIRDILSRIPDPNFFHPGSRIQGKKDSGSGSTSKNLSVFNSKNRYFASSRKYDPGCLSRIRIADPDLDFSPIPDPGSRPSYPGSGSATLWQRFYLWFSSWIGSFRTTHLVWRHLGYYF